MSTAAKGTRELQIGAEEEFHVVDLESRRTTPEVDTLLSQLDGEEFAPELQRSLVETNTPVCRTLDELRGHLQRLRARLASAAEPPRLGVGAAGRVPRSTSTAETSPRAPASPTCSTSTRCWSTSST